MDNGKCQNCISYLERTTKQPKEETTSINTDRICLETNEPLFSKIITDCNKFENDSNITL